MKFSIKDFFSKEILNGKLRFLYSKSVSWTFEIHSFTLKKNRVMTLSILGSWLNFIRLRNIEWFRPIYRWLTKIWCQWAQSWWMLFVKTENVQTATIVFLVDLTPVVLSPLLFKINTFFILWSKNHVNKNGKNTRNQNQFIEKDIKVTFTTPHKKINQY